ncbi:nuclear transport factor 2 family protein [Chryseobacterium sp. T1]
MKKSILTLSFLGLAVATLSSCEKKENREQKIAPKQEYSDKNTQDEANKKLVLDFYQKMFGDKDLSAVDQYIAPEYIQHNPTVADGAEAFKKAAAVWFKGQPKTKIDVQHVAADGDLVFVHLKDKNPDGTLVSTIDIFKIANNKIVEHWDVHQDVPKESANNHPMF